MVVNTKTMQCVRLNLTLPTDPQHAWYEVTSVYLESIDQLHYRQYKRPIAIDDSDDHPTQICFAHHYTRAGSEFTAV